MKRKNSRSWTIVFITTAAVLSVGCATTGSVPGRISDEAYLDLTPEEQKEYRVNRVETAKALDQKKDAEYEAGDPVHYGHPKDGFTLQWLKLFGIASICKGHTTGNTGIEASMCAVALADKNGRVGLQNINGVMKPTILMSNTTSQKGLGRVFIEGGFQVLAAGANGALGAYINNKLRCDDCGDTWNVMGGSGGSAAADSASGSSSSSETEFSAIMGCQDRGCDFK